MKVNNPFAGRAGFVIDFTSIPFRSVVLHVANKQPPSFFVR